MAESNELHGFLPSATGLHFANRFSPGPTLRVGPIAVGDASAGLCGGMSWFVREQYLAGGQIPALVTPPPNGSAFFRGLVRRQVLSLDWMRTPFRFWWMGAIGPRRARRQSLIGEWPRIRGEIDAGRPAMVGLVRHGGINPFHLIRSHQVLAFAYDASAEAVSLRIYDPNWPDHDDVSVRLDPQGMAQSTGERLAGWLSLA